MDLIGLRDASCSFSDRLAYKGRFTAVSSMTTDFKDDGRHAIAGKSGSGKAVLIRTITGLQRPSIGTISMDDSPVYRRTRAGKGYLKKAQIIQQNPASALDLKLPIGWSIEEPLLYFFQTGEVQWRKRCRQPMELCSPPGDYYTRLPSGLSGDEQKRVAIVRALVVEPQYLIFGETASGFDLPLRKKIIDEVINLQHRLDFTLIFITYDMELIVAVTDKIFVMRDSNLMEHTAPSGDYSVFQNPYSGMLLEVSGLTGAPSDRNNKMKERIVLQ